MTTSEEIFQKIQDLIVDQFAVERDSVTMDTSFEEDLGADSVDLMELVLAMEEEFDIGTDDEQEEEYDMSALKTVGDVVRCLSERLD